LMVRKLRKCTTEKQIQQEVALATSSEHRRQQLKVAHLLSKLQI